MSGHSKWSTIKRKKEKTDAKKGKIFTKIGREIAVAVKQGGPDPDTNSRLRDCIAKAKANNMPNDNIARSIKKASGELGNINYEEITYEGYGANGVAVKGGGSLGANGCVSWMFDKKGVIEIEDDGSIDEDELMMTAIDAGADDFSSEDGVFTVLTDPAGFSGVREALEKAGYEFLSADIDMVPQNMVEVNAEQADSIYKLLDLLEDNDDVQNVYHNANLPEEEE